MGKIHERENFTLNCGFSGVCSAKLEMSEDPVKNHIFTIILKVWLKQISPPAKATDMLGTQYDTSPWEVGEWQSFRDKFKKAGQYWHRRCYLIPPASASEFEFSAGWFKPSYIPNVECHFDLQLVDNPSAHTTINVAKIKASESFASDKQRMIQTDADPNKSQIAAAHEIGHMLGQPHIGELAHTLACTKAIKGEYDRLNSDDRRMYSRGPNSLACYGWGRDPNGPIIFGNIMGLGMEFDTYNAISWKTALGQVLWKGDPKFAEKWEVGLGSYRNPRMSKPS